MNSVNTERVLLKDRYDRGKAEGLAEGEAITSRKHALNLKNLGVDIDTISKATGLTAKEIEAL